ncbi:MAG: hypothetical protein AAFR56_12110, partial [Chloroflexota bacterium]
MSDSQSWVLSFDSPALEKPIELTLESTDDQIIIGRNDARTEIKAHIDLGPLDAAKKGVSRNHVRIFT